MRSRLFFLSIILLLVTSTSSGCSVVQSFSPTLTPTSTLTATATLIPATPTLTATPTEIPYFVDATVITGTLQVPILIYHRFFPDDFGPTTATKMQLTDFKNELQFLYESGFSLISLKSWIDGTFIVPEGRRPLIITMDDLWFADQIYLEKDGTPSEISGIGILWKFSQEHPDFGFHVAVFSNMGDKFYADRQVGDRFIIGEGDAWKDKLGSTIAWAIENGVEVYNHLYQHPKLDITENKDILYQIGENDRVTRYFLNRVGRDDLIPRLENIIALPYGIWPANQSGKNILLNYKNPEGEPLMAVMEAYNLDAAQFTSSFFSSNFNAFAIPRITASRYMIDYIVSNKESTPLVTKCRLGPLEESMAQDQETLRLLISEAIKNGTCSSGIVFHVNGYIFYVNGNDVVLHVSPNRMDESTTPVELITPTP